MTDARTTQTVSEQWINPSPQARSTITVIEMWGPGGTTQPRAVATLVALEMWTTVAPDARGGPIVSMIW